MPEVQTQVSFDRGIENVSLYASPAQEALPHNAPLVPGASQYVQELQRLLFAPSVEQQLFESLAPELKHREILNPTFYHATLENCRRDLETLATEQQDPAIRERLERAVEELQQESELSQLLTTFRSLLHKA